MINPMMLAHTKLLVPKYGPNKWDAPNSTAKIVMPEAKTAKYNDRR
jgi:hypothetical protein